jgi:hypothetical protein
VEKEKNGRRTRKKTGMMMEKHTSWFKFVY